VAVVAGFGWLYLLREAGILALPPRVPGALALQQLAGDDAQPLARMAAAWLVGGAAVGAGLSGFSQLGRSARVAAFALAAALVLLLLGAVTDALTNNQRLSAHLASQAGHAASWVALALLVTGFELGGLLKAGHRSASGRAASGRALA
jgi:hypothetical protein